MADFSIKVFSSKLYQKAFEDDIFSRAAQVGFYFSFAIFPLLLFLVSLFGIFLDATDNFKLELFFYLKQIMPYSAYELVRTTIEETTQNSGGGKLTIGLLIAIWSASAGIDSLRNALNAVFDFKETRSWWKTKLISIIFTVLLTLLITTALGAVFYGWKFASFLLTAVSIPDPSPFYLVAIQWIITLVVLLIIFELLYNVLPDRKPFRWFWITPGATVGIILWLILSNSLKTYLEYFNNYDRTYGSIGAVIILMLWLYLTALVILVGGIINSIMEEFKIAKQLETTIDEVDGEKK
ncbi:MAG: YihY/virulence factor BrkB family protein [Acidobacteria bacterium]|nr:YihY/virulence factor BrkB family protein [Acidobacteriota bacterium]